MATGFSVFVKIGGKLDGSLGAAVNAAKTQVGGLASSFSRIGRGIQAPFIAVENSMKAAEKRMASVARAGRNMSLAVTTPGLFAGKSMFDNLFGTDKEIARLSAYGELNKEQTVNLVKNAEDIARAGRAPMEAAIAMERRFVQAGRSVEETIGMTRAAIDFSLFGDIDADKAADTITGIAAAYGLVAKNAKEAEDIAWRIGDLLAKGANISKADVKDFAEAFKYAAPLASRAGVEPEMLAAAVATEVQKGILGNEAGVNIRSMLVRMVKPTQGAHAILKKHDLSFADFIEKWQAPDVGGFSGFMMQKGVDVGPLKKQLESSIKGMDISTQANEMQKKLSEAVVKGLKLKPRDAKIANAAVSDWIYSLADEIDFKKFVETLQAKGLTLGDISRLFDARQGARSATLFGDKTFQEMYEGILVGAPGSSKRGADIMFDSLYGSVLRLKAAWSLFVKKLGDAGATKGLTDFFERMTKWLTKLSDADKELLRMGTYMGAAALAAGPLLWALGSIGRVGAVALRGLAGAARLLVWPFRAAAGAATLLRGALMFTGIGAVLAAIAAAGAFIYNNWKGLLTFFESFGESFKKAIGPEASAHLETLGDWLMKIVKFFGDLTGEIDASGEKWKAWGASAGQTAGDIVNWFAAIPEKITAIWDGLTAGFEAKLLALVQSIGGYAKQIVAAFEGINLYDVGAAIINSLWNGIKNTFNGMLSGIRTLGGLLKREISSAFSWSAPAAPTAAAPPGRAIGGPVQYGRPYVVGERGPELFVPHQNGRIETNSSLRALTESGSRVLAERGGSRARGDIHVTNHWTISGADDPQKVARFVDSRFHDLVQRMEAESRGYLSD